MFLCLKYSLSAAQPLPDEYVKNACKRKEDMLKHAGLAYRK